MEMDVEKEKETINTISFSPDNAFINVGTTVGFRIYSTNPEVPVHSDRLRGSFLIIIILKIEKGSIKFVQNISNLVVYVRNDGE